MPVKDFNQMNDLSAIIILVFSLVCMFIIDMTERQNKKNAVIPVWNNDVSTIKQPNITMIRRVPSGIIINV
jgi:hypothetical protein